MLFRKHRFCAASGRHHSGAQTARSASDDQNISFRDYRDPLPDLKIYSFHPTLLPVSCSYFKIW